MSVDLSSGMSGLVIDTSVFLNPSTSVIFDTVSRYGGEARIVGGAVRDYLSNVPVHDVDFACNLSPDIVVQIFRDAGYVVIDDAVEYGTVRVIVNSQAYEVTTLRRDDVSFGRGACVSFTADWETDAARRDFTMNALYIDQSGSVYDYFDGLNDLRERVVRFIGKAEDRVREDYLRILRYFRFVARYECADFMYSDLFSDNADGFSIISRERITDELQRFVQYPYAAKVITTYNDFFCKALGVKENFLLFLEANLPVGMSVLDELEVVDRLWLFFSESRECLRDARVIFPKRVKKIFRHLAWVDVSVETLKHSCLVVDRYTRSVLVLHRFFVSRDADEWVTLCDFLSHINEFCVSGDDLRSVIGDVSISAVMPAVREFWLRSDGVASKEMCLEYARNFVSRGVF